MIVGIWGLPRAGSHVVQSVCGYDVIMTHFQQKYKICPAKKEEKRGPRTDDIMTSTMALDWPCEYTPRAMSSKVMTAQHRCTGLVMTTDSRPKKLEKRNFLSKATAKSARERFGRLFVISMRYRGGIAGATWRRSATL